MTNSCKDCKHHVVRTCCGAHHCEMLHYVDIPTGPDTTNEDIQDFMQKGAFGCEDYEQEEP